MRNFVLGLIMILLAASPVSALPNPDFKHIGIREGLSNGFIIDVAIDGQGFVWAATETGVCRLSGCFVTEFTKSNSNIGSNEIVCLFYYSPKNQIWIGTKQSGISIYNCGTGTFTRLSEQDGLSSPDIADISEAADGGIWILHRNKGIQHYDSETGISRDITPEAYIQLSSQARVCVDDGLGHLYVGHFGGGLSVIDLNKKKLAKYTYSPTSPQSLPSDYIRAIMIDSKQNVWIGTNAGAALFNPTTKEIRRLDNKKMAGDNIFDITETADGRIWLASDLGGLTIFHWNNDTGRNPEEAEVSLFTAKNSGLSSPNVRKIREDSFGNIWIAHYSMGFDFVPANSQPFGIVDFKQADGRYYKIYGLTSDSDDNIWVGGENMLVQYRDGRIQNVWSINPPQNKKESMIYAIHPDKNGTVWLGINDVGVMRFEPKSGNLQQVDLGHPLDVHAFWEDENGTIYIGTENSLFSFKDGKVTEEKEINRRLHAPTIYALMRDGYDRLWIGTLARGIYLLDENKKLVTHLDESKGFPSNNVNQIFEDSRGNIWVATYDGLVLIRNVEKLSDFKTFNESNGLSDNHIRAIGEDRKGNIWVTTYKGLSCLKNGKATFANYDYTDGLPEGGFVENAIAVSSDGTMYLASPNGVGFFNPLECEQERTVSPLQVINIESLNPHDHGRKIILKDGRITLPYDENSLRIEFTVQDYAQIQKAEYSYMMEGLDKSWIFLGAENNVTFRNLPAGTYTLKLRARLKNGTWDKGSIYTQTIKVTPPIWWSWYSKVLYLIVCMLIAYYLFRTYRKRLLLRNSFELQKKMLEVERQKHQDEQDLNNERMRFYTNIAHELRTPLTLIIGPLEDLEQEKALPAAFKPQIKSIHSNSIRLLNLINQIMEFRKTETQNRQLTVAKGDLSALVTEIGLRYKELHRNENVEFRLEVEQLSFTMYFDREIITTIINNFLSNAIKYTTNGHITLRLDACMEGDVRYARIAVEDTGYGIEADALPHIYERYYQVKGRHQASGTGIGLALVKSLAELHKGLLKVDSKLGVGSTFYFLISMSEIYPNALHKEEPAGKNQQNATEAADAETDSRPSILVIEDNKDIRDYVVHSFRDKFRVLEAENGKEGLDCALQNIPDIIISDIMMPEMDGIELCKAIKEDIRTSHIPVILLTAKDTLQDKETGYEIGADSYITKPFSAKLLRLRVRNILEGRKRLMQIIMRKTSSVDGDPTADEERTPDTSSDTFVPQLGKLDQEFLDRLNKLIEENMVTGKLDMAFLSDKMNMSHSTFYRKLKMLTGLTAVDYVKKLKLKRSLQLIASKEYNITEIAYKAGFNSPAHYREAFKDEYGMSPSQYIKQKK